MAYADVKSRLLVHAATAAAACSPPVESVAIGFPLPKSDCVRVFYGGEADPPRTDGQRWTLNSEMVGQVTMIALFLPITSLDEELSTSIDARAQAFAHALRTAVDGDADLNSNADNTILEDATPDVIVSGNTRFLALTWRVLSGWVEYTVVR